MRPARESQKESCVPDRQLVLAMAIAMIVRELLAAVVPLGNDEVYYWDWGRDLKLSYFDHPPGVSWLAAGAQTLFAASTGGLPARGLIPVVHFLTGLCLFSVYRDVSGSRRNRVSDMAFLAMTLIIPAFAIGGFLLLPDAGLLLAASAGLLLALRMKKKTEPLTIRDGIAMGAVAGMAGLFKYHAAPIFGGILLGMAITRKSQTFKEGKFWLTVVLTGLTFTLPVWIWNARNDMASFAFQASRGVSGARIDLPRAFRTLAGEFIFLGPGFFGLLVITIITMWRHRRRGAERIVLFATTPLLLLIHITMIYKEVLPHWGLPAFWLLIPDAATIAGQRWSRSKLRLNSIVSACISIAIVSVVAIPVLRNRMVELANGKPGALGELTFWPEFRDSAQWREIRERSVATLSDPAPGHCPDHVVLASFRWFTTAHMAWSMPGNPVVRSFEPGRRYYYHDRDRDLQQQGCPVLAIGEKAHNNPEIIHESLRVTGTGEVVEGKYLDRPLIWWAGYLK